MSPIAPLKQTIYIHGVSFYVHAYFIRPNYSAFDSENSFLGLASVNISLESWLIVLKWLQLPTYFSAASLDLICMRNDLLLMGIHDTNASDLWICLSRAIISQNVLFFRSYILDQRTYYLNQTISDHSIIKTEMCLYSVYWCTVECWRDWSGHFWSIHDYLLALDFGL